MTTHTPSAHSDLSTLLSNDRRTGRVARVARWIVGFGAVLLVVAIAVTIRGKAATPAVTYRTEALSRGTLSVSVSATGNLQPTNTVNVGSELSGLVDAVLVDENDTVRRGQVLARLDTARLQDQIVKSQAALASAQARLAQANATTKEALAALERLREVSRLSGGKVPSKAEHRPDQLVEGIDPLADRRGRADVPNGALRYTPPAATPTESRGLIGMLMPRPPGARSEQKRVTAADGTKTMWVVRDGQPVAIQVTPGSTNGRVTEISGDGLADGLQVIVDSGSAQS